MFEFLDGVSAQRIKGSLPFEASGVLRGRFRLYLDTPDSVVNVTLNGGKFTVGPRDLPPGFELKTVAPPYEIDFEAGGNIRIDGQGRVDALIYFIADPEQFRASLMHYFGNDDILKALGVISTEINNLKPEPAIVRVRW